MKRDPREAINAAMAERDNRFPEVIRGSSFVRTLPEQRPIIDSVPCTNRARLLGLTGMTGHGKTTIATAVQVALVAGLKFAGQDVERGRVAVFCGENPDDYNAHLIATMQQLGLEPADLDDLLVIPGRMDLAAGMDWLERKVEEFGELTAVFVDTSAAYFMGDDDNGNVQMYKHAAMLRALTRLPGNPTVFVLCHPVKNAQKDNLLPRGGGAFLNELDANLTVWREESVVTLHWAGKMRGPQFEPLRFELVACDLDGYQDAKGRPVRSSFVRPIQADAVEQIEAKALDDENRLLLAMLRKPGGTLADWSLACSWANGAGTPNKARAHRTVEKLKGQALTEKNRMGAWCLTAKGRREAEGLLR